MSSTVSPILITIIGDDCVGKTCLIETYVKNEYPEYIIPTESDNKTSTVISVGNRKYTLILYEKSCQVDSDFISPLSFKNTNCFLLCYSIADRYTFENIESKWWSEISYCGNKIPIVLVGTKLDLRIENTPKFVTTEEGEDLKEKIHANSFVECSAWKKINLQNVFEESIRAIKKKKSKKPQCRIL